MSKLLSKSMIACCLALACASLCAVSPAASADDKKPAKSKPAPKQRAHPKAVDTADSPDADISNTITTEYNCELGNKITIFHNDSDDTHIALRWKKKIHRLERVGTTTGALRFENTSLGLIWIGIPSKGMLLDSKLNRQLANECKNADQSKTASLDAAAPK
jgi:membrane-bound inhibitor of C-type lysozyme